MSITIRELAELVEGERGSALPDFEETRGIGAAADRSQFGDQTTLPGDGHGRPSHDGVEDLATLIAQIAHAYVGHVSIVLQVILSSKVRALACSSTQITRSTGGSGSCHGARILHDRRPFFAGTYFPPAPRHGMPAFPQVLMGLTDARWGG